MSGNPWFRMYGDVINDPKVMRLPEAMRWRWTAMLCLASRNDGTLPAVPDIAFALRISEDEAGATLWDLNAAGLIDEVEPGVYAPHNWEGRQYKSDSSTKRVQKHRDKLREQVNVSGNDEGNVSCNERNVSVTPPEQNRAETEQNSRSVEARPARAPSRFDEFWQAYPRRDGPNPRKPAEAKFNALVKSGLDPQMLIAEAAKLREAERARGQIGTRFIPQAATWLNQQRWADHAAIAFLAETSGVASDELQIESAVKFFARTGVWSRHAPGPEPGHSGCRAPPELLARYGLAPDGRKLSVVAA